MCRLNLDEKKEILLTLLDCLNQSCSVNDPNNTYKYENMRLKDGCYWGVYRVLSKHGCKLYLYKPNHVRILRSQLNINDFVWEDKIGNDFKGVFRELINLLKKDCVVDQTTGPAEYVDNWSTFSSLCIGAYAEAIRLLQQYGYMIFIENKPNTRFCSSRLSDKGEEICENCKNES